MEEERVSSSKLAVRYDNITFFSHFSDVEGFHDVVGTTHFLSAPPRRLKKVSFER